MGAHGNRDRSPEAPLKVSPRCVSVCDTNDGEVCYGSIVDRIFGSPAAVIGLTHACTAAAERALHFGRAFITPQLEVTPPDNQQPYRRTVVLGAQPLVAAKSCSPISVVLQIGERTHAARPHNSHFCLI